MGSALVVALVKYGLLTVLWLFVIVAFRTVKSDLFGSRAPARASAVATAPRAPASDRPVRARSQARRLVVTEGALAGTTIGLSDTVVTLGRADDSTLVISDDYASTRHARLVPSEGSWTLEDLGSTNGTYLSGAKVVRPTPVPIGQQIRIGKTVLELRR